jgi:hypothetical protein
MTTPAISTPNILTDPGFLLWAPLGSTVPTGTVAGSKFTDPWDVAWINLGATQDGSDFSYSSTVEAIRVAELFDPIHYVTTERTGKIAFNLADYTAANLKIAFNGGALTTSGTTATTMNTYTPPTPGSEVRCMIGWESLDSTVRLICHQTLQGGDVQMAFKRAPSIAVIPTTFNLEVPDGGVPFTIFTAGESR